jgi:chromosome partitioning protein
MALEGVSDLIDTLKRVKASINPALRIEGVLLTMYDERTNLSKQVAAEIRKYFTGLVYGTQIPRNVRIGEAPSFGKPVVLYDVASKGAISYMNLAREVLVHDQKGAWQRAGSTAS